MIRFKRNLRRRKWRAGELVGRIISAESHGPRKERR
jgi:hypothetical protein